MADEYYNNKIVTTDGDVLIDLTSDTAEASDVLQGRTLHLASGAPAVGTYRPSDEIVARLEATVGHSSKNLYQITVDTQTINGVTHTVDKTAGTITANGTSPSNAEASLTQLFVVTPQIAGKKYFSVSLNQTGSSTTFDAYLYDQTAHKFVTKWDGSTRSPYIYGTESQEVLLIEGHTVVYSCRIFKNQTVSNLIYKPMIRDSNIIDDTFEPYQEPTDSLIETKARAYLTSTVGHACKNLLDLTKYVASANVTNIVINPETGSVSANASGAWKNIYWDDTTLNLDANKRYIVSVTNNEVNTIGRIAIRNKKTGLAETKINLSTVGKFSFDFSPSDYPSGYRIGLFITFSNSSSATGSVDISNFMLCEASISDDTFEPYQIPTDERVYSLNIAAANVSQYVPDPDEGIYWITIIDHYSTWNTQFDIYISTPNSDGGYFFGALEDYPIPKHEVKLPRFRSYKGKAISFGIIAGPSDPVMAISSNPGMFSSSHTTSRWDKVFDVDTFLNFCDVKDGSATNYMHIHLCDDGGIRNQAEYEAYIGG